MAGLIEFSHDVIWYSGDGPWRAVLCGAEAYLDEPGVGEALETARQTDELIFPAIDAAQAVPLLRALDRSVVRLMAELINAAPPEGRDDGQLDHYAELRSMIRGELALSPGPPP